MDTYEGSELMKNGAQTEFAELEWPEKGVVQSMTVWGVVIAGLPHLISSVAGILGFELSPDAAQELVSSGQEAWGHFEALMTTVGGMLAVVGIRRAKSDLSLRRLF